MLLTGICVVTAVLMPHSLALSWGPRVEFLALGQLADTSQDGTLTADEITAIYERLDSEPDKVGQELDTALNALPSKRG